MLETSTPRFRLAAALAALLSTLTTDAVSHGTGHEAGAHTLEPANSGRSLVPPASRMARGEANDPDTPAAEHETIDVVPTLDEEAELLLRVESEGLGINPRSQAAQLSSATDASATASLGRWEPLQNWPVIGVFTALLPDGRVLAYDSVGDRPAENSDDHTFTRAALWDPVTEAFSRIDSDTGYNLFCSGFSTLPDGRLFIAGGNANASLDGIVETHTFNPISDNWERGQRMDFDRWYPAVTPLPNGEMLITGGGQAIPEVREIDSDIRRLNNAASSLWDNRLYPWLQTAPNGNVAFLGPDRQLGYVDTAGTGSFRNTIQREGPTRNYGSYALYDIGRAMVAGGGFHSGTVDQRKTTLINLNNDSVSVSGSMNYRRRQHNLTVLADGSVLATGGFASNNGLVDLDNSVYAAELWNPDSGQWQVLAEEDRARQYHSTALLLPDGRVLSAGGGICGDCQRDGYLQKNGQVFTPPYLFEQDGSGELATRPVIDSAPTEVLHDTLFNVSSSAAGSIANVAMARIGSVTHSQNMEQRYIPLDFTVAGSEVRVRSPLNANIAPPGYYMLFLLDQAGVPSVARMVNVKNSVGFPSPANDVFNAATAGTASQSSTASGAVASRAIDNVVDGNAANGSVSMTASGSQPWWTLDLGEVQDIRQIVINRRSDCCTDRLSNFHVMVSDTPISGNSLSNALAQSSVSDYYQPGSASESRIDINRNGRYVRVQLAGDNALELAEVQVLVPGDDPGTTCGSPNVDPAVDAGAYVWKACDGPWTFMLTGEADAGLIQAVGTLTSDDGFDSVVPRSIESSDSLSTSGQRTDFNISTASPWMDHFEFSVADDSSLCLGLNRLTSNQQLYVGPNRVPAGTGPVNPATLASCELDVADCSAPSYDTRSDKALVSWVDCFGVLHMVGMVGLDFGHYRGHVYSSTRFTATNTRSFESSDLLASVSDSDIYFDMGVGGGYRDEILLTPASGDSLCIEVTEQASGSTLLAGSNRTPVTSPFDPVTLQSCEPLVDNSDCGNPQVDTSSDSALFIWKNCDGTWSTRLTGVAAGGRTVNVFGSITSSDGFNDVTPVGVESSDSVSTAPGGPIAFNMTTINPYSDGFDFTVAEGAELCVTITSPPGALELLAGPGRTPVGTAFNPETFAACG